MPNSVQKIDGKWRVVEKATGKPTTNEAGTHVDGGGHETWEKANAQATAINLSQLRAKGAKIPYPKK